MNKTASCAVLALSLGGCSVILPLGSEYTFGGDVDAGPGTDSGPQPDSGVDAGPICETIPSMEEVCADHCGTLVVCETSFTCPGCIGELTCGGAGTDNQCGCATAPCAVAGTSIGDIADQRITGIAVDPDGNVFVVGNFKGTIQIGTDVHTNDGMRWNDVFIAKFDPEGTALWSRAYGATTDGPTDDDDQSVADVAVDGSGNVVFVGEGNGPVNFGGDLLNLDFDPYMVKLDGDGNHLFSDVYSGTSGVNPIGVGIDPGSSEIYFTGAVYGTLTFGPRHSVTATAGGGYFDIFLARFQPDGTPLAARRFGDEFEQNPSGIAVTGSHVYLAANFTGTFDFGTLNRTTLTSTSYYSMALTKLSHFAFSHQWSLQFGTEVSRIELDANLTEDVLIGGYFQGQMEVNDPPFNSDDGDTFLARLNSDGEVQWSDQYSNINLEDVALADDGSMYVAGSTSDSLDFGAGPVGMPTGSLNAFIAHLDSDGSPLWVRVFEAAVGDQRTIEVDLGSDSEVWAGFRFEGTVDFGTGELRTEGSNDIALVRYDQ